MPEPPKDLSSKVKLGKPEAVTYKQSISRPTPIELTQRVLVSEQLPRPLSNLRSTIIEDFIISQLSGQTTNVGIIVGNFFEADISTQVENMVNVKSPVFWTVVC